MFYRRNRIMIKMLGHAFFQFINSESSKLIFVRNGSARKQIVTYYLYALNVCIVYNFEVLCASIIEYMSERISVIIEIK